MIALLRKKKPLPEAPPQPAADEEQVLLPAYERVFLLIPEGAYTYQLVVFLDVKSAATYVDSDLLPERSVLAFWVTDPDNPKGRSQSGEALVLVTEGGRPEIVTPYSFTEVEGARAFMASGSGRAEAERPLLFWAEPVSIPRGLTLPQAESTPSVSPRDRAAVYAQSAPVRSAQPLAPSPVPAALALAYEAEPRSPGVMSRVSDWPAWEGLGPRMVAASRASKKVYYEAVDDDPYADGRAALIVVIGAFSAGIASLGDGVSAPLWHFAAATGGWLLCVTAVHFIAVNLLPGKRPAHSYRRLGVAMGLAYSPAIFLMLGALPVYGPMFTLAVLGWLFVTAVVAIETALELERESALVTAIAGWMFLFAFTLIVPQMIT